MAIQITYGTMGLISRTRLEEAGFNVRVFFSTDIVNKKDIIRLGVKQEIIFLCNKSIDLEKSSKLKQNLL